MQSVRGPRRIHVRATLPPADPSVDIAPKARIAARAVARVARGSRWRERVREGRSLVGHGRPRRAWRQGASLAPHPRRRPRGRRTPAIRALGRLAGRHAHADRRPARTVLAEGRADRPRPSRTTRGSSRRAPRSARNGAARAAALDEVPSRLASDGPTTRCDPPPRSPRRSTAPTRSRRCARRDPLATRHAGRRDCHRGGARRATAIRGAADMTANLLTARAGDARGGPWLCTTLGAHGRRLSRNAARKRPAPSSGRRRPRARAVGRAAFAERRAMT